ncbi:hypothetical protein Hanom_Chr16g01485761 [Helianthus anomalus]
MRRLAVLRERFRQTFSGGSEDAGRFRRIFNITLFHPVSMVIYRRLLLRHIEFQSEPHNPTMTEWLLRGVVGGP